MRLSDLNAHFVRLTAQGFYFLDGSIEIPQGVTFLCPKCLTESQGTLGTHRILIWFEGRGVPSQQMPSARWKATGMSLEDLSLEPAIQKSAFFHPDADCVWHGWVKNGDAS